MSNRGVWMDQYSSDVRRSIEDIERYIYSNPPARGGGGGGGGNYSSSHSHGFDQYGHGGGGTQTTTITTTRSNSPMNANRSTGGSPLFPTSSTANPPPTSQYYYSQSAAPPPSHHATSYSNNNSSFGAPVAASIDFLDVVQFLRCRYGDSVKETAAGRDLSSMTRDDALALVECFRQELMRYIPSHGSPGIGSVIQPSQPFRGNASTSVVTKPTNTSQPITSMTEMHGSVPRGASERSQSPNVMINTAELQLLLRRGEMFVKFGRSGEPKLRFVCLQDFAGIPCVTWSSDPRSSPHGQLPMHTLRKVERGAKSPIFSRHMDPLSHRPLGPRGVPVDDRCCFSLYFDGRTLDLCASSVSVESAIQIASQWIVAFSAMIQQQQ